MFCLKISNLKKAFSKVESKSVKAQQKLLEKAEQLYLAAARKAGDAQLIKYILSHSPEKEEKSISNENIRYAIKYPSFTKEDIYKNINKLADMKPVANIDASKLEKTGKAPSLIFEEYFASLGNSIYSDVYGDISLGKSSVKSEIRHGITATKIASIEAIPSVIEKGEVIFFESKQGGDERVKRIVVAAPIIIADIPYYMGVMLQRDPTTQYLYLHNVAIEKEMSEYSRAHLVTTGADEQNEHLSVTIILQNAINVKLKKQKSENNFNFSTEKSVENGDNGGLTETVTRINEEKEQVTKKEDTPGENNSDVSGDIRFSFKKKEQDTQELLSQKDIKYIEIFNKQFDAWDGKTEGFAFVLGETPSYLSSLEVDGKKIGKKQVRIDATKIKKIMHDHVEMESDVIKNLPYLLNDPILVLDSKTVKGRIVLLGEVYAKGKPVMMALELNPTTRSGNSTYVNVIKVASAYTRSNIQNMISTSNIRFVNENESRVNDWLKVNRLQLPLPNSQSNSATYIIPENTEKVNRNSEKVSDDDENIRLSLKDTRDNGTNFTALSSNDLGEYLKIGKTLHTRNKKQRMLENGKSPILTSESQIKEFISNAIHGKAGGEVRAFARVSERLSDAISKVRSSLDLEGDYLELQADALREAYKVHSTPKQQGDIPLTESDFQNLHRHIFEFDGILSVNDYNGKTEVHIYRRAEKGYYHIITVSSSERSSLQITKLIGVSKEKFEEKYAKKIERSTGSPRMQEASNPSTKARHTAGALPNNIIPENTEKVNRNSENNSDADVNIRFSLIGRTEDGRGIYCSNYPENTPKTVKQEDIIKLVQNVWSKKPIKLNLIVNGKNIPIEARFNPELSERSDLGKIAFGNRKGTASEKRITMNLSSDFYQIAEESRHVGSKTETGKDNAAHSGVTTWHYFLTDLVYVEADGTEIECYMNIDVKQNDSGNWFYSFAIEKGSRPADVLSVVTDKSATTSNNIIPENAEKVNTFEKISSDNISEDAEDIKFSLKDPKRTYSYRLADGKVEKYSPYSYVRKVYSKKETEGIINDVLSNYLSFGDAYGVLSGKSTNEVINMLWRGFNTAVFT